MEDDRPDYSLSPVDRSKAIRLKCLDCTGFQPTEVRLCPSVKCPLWPWRLGPGRGVSAKKVK